MSFTQQMQLARALGSKRYADAIGLLKQEIEQIKKTKPPYKGLKYLFCQMGTCHQAIGGAEHFGLAVKAAEQALKIDANLFYAHRLLADLYCGAGQHVLGALHARDAIKHAKPPERVPIAVVRIVSFILLILRRRDAVARLREETAKDHYTAWLTWAKDYIEWNDQRGNLVAANQQFRPAPRPAS